MRAATLEGSGAAAAEVWSLVDVFRLCNLQQQQSQWQQQQRPPEELLLRDISVSEKVNEPQVDAAVKLLQEVSAMNVLIKLIRIRLAQVTTTLQPVDKGAYVRTHACNVLTCLYVRVHLSAGTASLHAV
jgi:hypothetical protein